MRTRALVLIALLAPLASDVSAQIGRLPRTGGRTPAEPAPPPGKEIPAVARALALQRSRWSAEAYTMISSVQVPAANGVATWVSALGAGTHADYRYTDRFSATIDVTASPLGSTVTTGTAEAGTRFKPMPFDEEIRPYFDLRAGYMYLSELYGLPSSFGSSTSSTQGQRYSRGFGGIAGAGIEYSVTNSLSISTEVSAMRGNMTTYRISPTAIGNRDSYPTTVVRFAFGLRYNAVRTGALKQDPRQ